MINRLLVAGTAQAIEDILISKEVPYYFRNDGEYRIFQKMWDVAESDAKKRAYSQAKPAVERIFSKEPYVFVTDGEPLCIRFNFLDSDRELAKDSFGEIMLERADIDWRFSISIKSDANVLSSMPVADRDTATYHDNVVNVFNEIDDFGDRIFSVPCSNEYFDEINAILEKIAPLDRDTWAKLLSDEDFAYENLITPMMKAFGAELPRIFRYHPEAPRKMIEYFYGKIDYYYIKPIEEVGVTRIGAVNAHSDLGRIPGTSNHLTQPVRFPTQLLDVKFASGKYGELSRDTIKFSFDGGWAVCVRISIDATVDNGRLFALHVYMPSTPFGSYRDQVEWESQE
jgi:hypothetical protein